MAFNAGFCHAQLETVGLASAPDWRGPWTLFSTEPLFTADDGSPWGCEDPVLWADPAGHLHMMVHNQADDRVSLYAHSRDEGRTWALHREEGNPGPYNGTIAWDDGSVSQSDVERPQLVMDPDNGRPLFLVNGAFWGASGDGVSFTLFRPLAQ